MLGKLIKYEFKSTSRIMWYLYGALIIVGGLIGLFMRSEFTGNDYGPFSSVFNYETGNTPVRIVFGSLLFIYVLMIQAIFIMTTIMIITRFYKNLLGGEGYLMHTLPVKTHNLILSKGIVAVIWGAIAIITGMLSGFVFSLTSGMLREIIRQVTWSEIQRILSEILTTNVILGFIMVILSAITAVISFYFAMALGNLANNNKFLYSVLAYVAIQVVMSIVLNIIGVTGGGFFGLLFGAADITKFLIIQIVQQLVVGIAFFFGTNYILKNKLNLA